MDVDLYAAAAVKGGIFVNDALLQTGSQHDGLEGRAWLVGVGDGLVGPLGVDCVGIGLLIGLLIGERRLFLLCQLSPLFLGLPDGILHRFLGGRFNLFGLLVHLGKQCGVSDGAVIVQVKVGTHGHAQDGAGIALHCDDHAAVLGLIPGAVLLQIALAICLYGRVDGQVDIIAIFRIVVVLEKVHQVSAHAVFRRDHQAGGAGQLALKLGFQAVGAAAVVGKADDLSGKAGIGIVPLGIGLEIDTAGQMVGVDQFPDLCLHIIFHLLGHPLILAVGVGALFPQAGGIQFQNAGQIGDHYVLDIPVIGRGILPLCSGIFQIFIQLLLLFGNGLGRQNDVIDRGTDRQHIFVGVVNGAPGGGDGERGSLLIHRQLLQFVMIRHLQAVQLHNERDKDEHAEHHHQLDGAAEDETVRLFARFPDFSLLIHCNTAFPTPAAAQTSLCVWIKKAQENRLFSYALSFILLWLVPLFLSLCIPGQGYDPDRPSRSWIVPQRPPLCRS